MIQGEERPKVVFCDPTSQIDDEVGGEFGFQRNFGSPGNLKPFSAFDVSLE